MENDQQNKNKLSDKTEGLKSFAKYSGIAVKMTAILLLFVWIGKKADEHYSLETPYFTLVASLLGIGVAMYSVIKDLMTNKDD